MTPREERIQQLKAAFHEGIRQAEWTNIGLQQVLDSHRESLALAQSLADVPGRGLLVAMCQRGIANLEQSIKNEHDRIKHLQSQIENVENDV